MESKKTEKKGRRQRAATPSTGIRGDRGTSPNSKDTSERSRLTIALEGLRDFGVETMGWASNSAQQHPKFTAGIFQDRVFPPKTLDSGEEAAAQSAFRALLDALTYGTPPFHAASP